MNLFDLVRNRRNSENHMQNMVGHNIDAVLGDNGSSYEDLNFMSAISAHINWRSRLESYLNGENREHLPPANFYSSCFLDRWINGPGFQKFGHLEEFQDFVVVHEQFHKSAEKIIKYIASGKHAEASQLFNGEYSTSSRRVVARLAYLHQLLGN